METWLNRRRQTGRKGNEEQVSRDKVMHSHVFKVNFRKRCAKHLVLKLSDLLSDKDDQTVQRSLSLSSIEAAVWQ